MPVRHPAELALLALLALLWGSSYLFVKIAVAEIPPVTLIAARVSLAAVLLLCVVALRHERLPRDRSTWGRLLVQAMFNSIGAWTLLAWGQRYVDSGLASVLNSTSPIFVFLLAWILARSRPGGALPAAGVALGIAGVGLTVGPEALAGLGREAAGQLAVLAGAALYAAAALYGRRFCGLPPTVTAAGTMLWASLWLVPASLLIDRPWTLDPSWRALLAAGILSVLCTAFALILYFRLVRTLGALGVASQSYLRAGVGVLLGTVLLGEVLEPAAAAGLVLIVAGVAAMTAPGRSA